MNIQVRKLVGFYTLLFSSAFGKAVPTPEDFKVQGLPLASGVPHALPLGYSGFFPVRKGTGSLFFWYFESKKPSNATHPTPLVIWFQGGPGASSMIGLFNLHGPLKITKDFKIAPRAYSWNEEYATLYIDQPVGSGYSYVASAKSEYSPECYNSEGYTIAQCGIGKDLLEFLKQFGETFPTLHNRPLYLTGESYAGKYLPTLAAAILDHNDCNGSGSMFDLKGFAIGDGLTDPESQILAYSQLSLSLGLANPKQSRHIQGLAEKAVDSAQRKDWNLATQTRNKLFDYYRTITNFVDFYDVRNGDLPHNWVHMEAFLNRPEVKEAVHVPAYRNFFRDPKVLSSMEPDIMKSVTHLFPKFHGRLKMLFFQGQFDYRDGPMSQYDWLYRVFPCLEKNTPKVWVVEGHTAGYSTRCSAEHVTHTVVLQAGHMVSQTQPARGLAMLKTFIDDQDFI